MRVRRLIAVLLLGFCTSQARGEAMLQLFNVNWDELAQKMPELAEAGYTSLWLPPPTKGSGGFSVGYDAQDPFDLGDKDQSGTIRTRYGTKEELLRMVEIAHRFGMRVYFDNIMNHRSFGVPGYNEFTPITMYPGLLPEDFHLRVTADGFFRKWDNIGNWNDAWQVQNRNFSDLIDLSQENPNFNFGLTEGSQNPKFSFVRHPNNPEYYPNTALGSITSSGVNTGWKPFDGTNGVPVAEDTAAYLIRAAMWLMHETKADGLRLDAVKHVPDFFFGGSDLKHLGYNGAVQTMYDYVHGYTAENGYTESDDNRNSNFDAEAVRNDALLFGEHLGEPPGFNGYFDSGMRLVDNPLRNHLNNVLGNPGSSLAGLDKTDLEGYSAGFLSSLGVKHAQSHDSDYAARRELQNAYYFMREGLANIYSDGYNKEATCRDCGGAFPRHANAPYLGEFGDNKMPDLVYLHGNVARGNTRSRWSDTDIVAWERYEHREGLSSPFTNPDATVSLIVINDNYGFPGDVSFDDGIANDTSGTFYGCFPVENTRGQGLVVGFPPGSVLYQLADSPGKERACTKLLVRKATNSGAEADSTKNHGDPVERKVYVGSQTLAPGGGAIELKIPSGGYVIYAYQPPEPSRPQGAAGVPVVQFKQGGQVVPTIVMRRKDGRDGDTGFNPIYPFKMRGSIDGNGNVIGGSNVSNLTYQIDIPVITNTGTFDIVVRTDSSAENVLLKLDGGMDINSHLSLGPTSGFDKRDNKPGHTFDMFLGFEQAQFQTRRWPEKFAAVDTARNQVLSLGAETYHYTVDGGSTSINGGGSPNTSVNTATYVFHDPNGTVTGGPDNGSNQRIPLNPGSGASAKIWVKVGYQNQINLGYLYYTTDGSNPEGGFGLGGGTTQVVSFNFSHNEFDGGAGQNADWWFATIPGQSSSVTVKYKLAFHKSGAIASYGDNDDNKRYGQTEFAIPSFNPASALVWLHNNLNTNHTVVGLQEGFHMVRARPFLNRSGKSSVYNTFFQTFYYDAAPPSGVIAFPASNGETLGSKNYGFVVRADATTTEVEYNIDDGDPNNDNPAAGNGLTNGQPAWARATFTTPLPSLSQTYPTLPLEYRFNYANVPSNGVATVTVRLKEASTATLTNRFATLVRTVNCAAPPQTLEIAFPATDGETINLDQADQYTLVARFSDTLSAVLTNFTLKIDGSVQATASLRFDDQQGGDGKNELRFDWGGMTAGSHLIEIEFNGDGLSLQASRQVNVNLTGVAVSIITPPNADAAGRSPFTIVLPDKTNAVPSEREYIVTTETSETVTNVLISFFPTTNAFSGGAATLNTNFVGTTKRWDFPWTNMVEGTFVIRADAFGGGSNFATRTTIVEFQQIVPDNPLDDDDDDDGISDTNEVTIVSLPGTQPEFWSNGQVHTHFFSGRTDPLNPDSDNDGLPDALELGLEGSIATNTNFSADTDGDGFKNFIGDAHPPKYNTTDNSGHILSKSRTDLLRGTVTDPNNPDTDGDGIPDGIEDINRNGRVEVTESGVTNAAPPTVYNTSRIDRASLPGNAIYLETDPNNADSDADGASDGSEDSNRNGFIAGDTNNNFTYDAGEQWTETDPRKADTDGDGLPDGWEVQYGIDPLDNGTDSFRTAAAGDGNADNGANGDPDGDGFTNTIELNSGTNPRINDNVPPPPADSLVIGPGNTIGSSGGVTWFQEFQDWRADDLKALDEYDGNGPLKRQRDVYPWWDGYDWSRDILAFYARDGGGDGNYYFRVDFHDLQYKAEEGRVDVYVVIDTGNPNVGEVNLPDDVDAKTDMRWEVVIAAYDSNNGRVYVRRASDQVVEARGYTPGGNGFRGSYYRSDLDAVEFAISRQALLDAGWNGSSPLQFQVFTTRDGTQNSPLGAGDIGGRADITDSIYDDDMAESDTQQAKETLQFWFTSINQNAVNLSNYSGSLTTTNRPNIAKVALVLHGNQAILPANVIQNLVSNNVVRTPTGAEPTIDPGNNGIGYVRALEIPEVFGTPLNLHLSGSLISALQWAVSDTSLIRSGPVFNQRIRSLVDAGQVDLLSGFYADHVAPYFTGQVNQAAIELQDDILRHVFGQNAVHTNAPLWLAERVLDGKTMIDLAANSGHSHVLIDQMVHFWFWTEQFGSLGSGRLAALGDGGYQINRFNGMKAFLVSGASDQMYFNHDLGTSITLRELLNRKAMSGFRDQVVILADNWEAAAGDGGTGNPDKLNLNMRWIANHPWIQVVTLEQIAKNEVDTNNDGAVNGSDAWFVHDRGTQAFNHQSKDFIRHGSENHYDNWFYGSAIEESFFNKFPILRGDDNNSFNTTTRAYENTGDDTLSAKKMGHVSTNGTILADAWVDVQGTGAGLNRLAQMVYLHGIFETAFHDDDNNNYERFSTGEYKFPDVSFDPLSQFALKPAALGTRRAGVVKAAATWAAGSPSATAVTSQTDIDHDGENEYIVSNDKVWAAFERIGGRMIAMFVRDATSGNAFQVMGNLASAPEFESEREADNTFTNNSPRAYRTSGFKDLFAQTGGPGVGTSQYINDLYNVAAAGSGTGWQFTSSDGSVTKTITLGNGTNRLNAAYSLGGSVNKLFVRHGVSPDLATLLFNGPSGLAGPITNVPGKVTFINSSTNSDASVTFDLASNIQFNATASDQGTNYTTVVMRNQAQTQQIELESTATSFSFGITADALEGSADADGDGLSNNAESVIGTDPNNPDTDGDGITDGTEVANGWNPLDANSPGCGSAINDNPALTVNGVSGNYTTTHVYVDEVADDSVPITITFAPNSSDTITAVEVFSNLNRRDKADDDANGDGIEDGIVPPDGNTISTNDVNHYYAAYTMTDAGGGTYTLTLDAAKCGSYRLTARYKVLGCGNWIWFTSASQANSIRRDHAIVVSPRKARDMTMYELNTLNVEATGPSFEQRSTFEDLWDGPGATLTTRFNLTYVKNLGANWLWFQPIHPQAIDGRQIDPATGQPYEVGSPYAVKNFFEVMPLMGKGNTRAAAMGAFTNFVGAADAEGVHVMLDAAFNHSAYDVELAPQGTNYWGGASPTQEIRHVESRFFARAGDYSERASSAANIAVAPDRGDFGKFEDTYEIFWGEYAALVDKNPDNNGDYLNEGDWFNYTDPNFDAVTRNVWRYFADYILYWLDKTGHPAGTPANESYKGIDGLRADFGQGLPPQAWEYIINKTRARKWDLVYMAESLDGGPVTYRSGRHFDVLNESILFALKGATTPGAYNSIFEDRRNAYGQAMVLLNTTSHDEENYDDPFEALIRYTCAAAIDGVPMIFGGQELGISRTFGFSRYELNFGKLIPHFKKYNSMDPIWNDTNFGLDQIYPVYASINKARAGSPALRSSNRFFLSPISGGGSIFAAAKYENATASSTSNDVVFAFASLDRNNIQGGTFNVNVDQGGTNLFGIKPHRLYNVKNIAAYSAIDNTRSNVLLWSQDTIGSQVGIMGSNLLSAGLFVQFNPVPTSNAGWTNAPFEAQYLKLFDVTPAGTPGAPSTPKNFAVTNSVTFCWTAPADAEGITGYHLTVGTTPGGSDVFNGDVGNNLCHTITGGAFGQTLYARVQAINGVGTSANSGEGNVMLIDPNADQDGDVKTNADEDAADTDPFNNASYLRILSIERLGNGDTELIWSSVPGLFYDIYGSTNIVSTPFTPVVTNIPSQGTTTGYTNPAPNSVEFYKIRVVP